jgi:hypothetical protein
MEASFSNKITFDPSLEAEYAAERPAGPPPTIAMSYLSIYPKYSK